MKKLETKKIPTSQKKKSSQPNQTRNLTITSSRECVCLEADWPLVRGFYTPHFPSLGRTESKVKRKRTEKKKQKPKTLQMKGYSNLKNKLDVRKPKAQPKEKCFSTGNDKMS